MSSLSDFDLFAMCLFSSVASLPVLGLLSMRFDVSGGFWWIGIAIVILAICRFGEGYLSAK